MPPEFCTLPFTFKPLTCPKLIFVLWDKELVVYSFLCGYQFPRPHPQTILFFAHWTVLPPVMNQGFCFVPEPLCVIPLVILFILVTLSLVFITDGPWFMMVSDYLTLMMVLKWCAFNGNRTLNIDFWSLIFSWAIVILISFLMLGSGSEPQFPVSHTIVRVNNWYSSVYCVASIFRYYILCFHIPSCLQNTHVYLLILVRRTEEGNYSWYEIQDSCPTAG